MRHFLAGDVAEDAYGQTRTGEGVALDEMFGHAERTADGAHFVLEEQSQRFAEL